MCNARLCSPIHLGLGPWTFLEKGVGGMCNSKDPAELCLKFMPLLLTAPKDPSLFLL